MYQVEASYYYPISKDYRVRLLVVAMAFWTQFSCTGSEQCVTTEIPKKNRTLDVYSEDNEVRILNQPSV